MLICNGDNERKLKINVIFLSPMDITLPKIIRPNQLISACNSDLDWLKWNGYTSIQQTGNTSLTTSIATPLAMLSSKWILDVYNAFNVKDK